MHLKDDRKVLKVANGISCKPQYRLGDVILGSLSNVVDKQNGFFFILPECSEVLILQNNSEAKRELLIDVDDLVENDIVGVLIDNCIFRASVEHINDLKRVHFYLMDTGETIELNSEEIEAFFLTPEMLTFDGLAVCCIVDEVSDPIIKFIELNYLTVVSMKVVGFSGDFPIVMLLNWQTKENVNLDYELVDKLYSIEDDQEHYNPLKAVLGFIPQDDINICRHYRPKTKDCYKGNSCRFLHIDINKDGISSDNIVTTTGIALKYILPNPGKTIMVAPTVMINMNTFYGHILEDDRDECFELLISQMNDPEYVKNYTMVPKDAFVPLMLVIAPYEGLYYRGQIKNILENGDIDVYFVDFGNVTSVKSSEVMQWISGLDFVAFQAVKIRIANVSIHKNIGDIFVKDFETRLTGKTIKCEVKSLLCEVNALCSHEDEGDLGELIISLGLGDLTEPIVPATNYTIPA